MYSVLASYLALSASIIDTHIRMLTVCVCALLLGEPVTHGHSQLFQPRGRHRTPRRCVRRQRLDALKQAPQEARQGRADGTLRIIQDPAWARIVDPMPSTSTRTTKVPSWLCGARPTQRLRSLKDGM